MADRAQALKRAVVPLLLAAALAVFTLVRGGDSGPLPGSSGTTVTCVPATSSDELTFGLDVIENTYDGSIEVTAVRLREPRAVRLVAAYLAPVRRGKDGVSTLVASAAQWPTPEFGTVDWAARSRVPGAKVPVGETADVILHLHRTGAASPRINGIEIEYRYRGHGYQLSTANGLSVGTPTCR